MATLELLATKWPAAFAIHQMGRRPLAIGIDRAILAALGDEVSPAELALALRCYVANKVYRGRLVTGATRIGLDGAPAGIVTEKQAAHAAKISARRLRQIAAKNAAKPKPTITAKPAAAKLSLADLRGAAQRRKAAAS